MEERACRYNAEKIKEKQNKMKHCSPDFELQVLVCSHDCGERARQT